MVRKIVTGSLVFISILGAACGSSSDREGFSNNAGASSSGGSSGTLGSDASVSEPGQPEECEKMDIVFVVDDSGSMKEEQANLAANFSKFIDKINSFKTKGGSKLDWRAAVTTTGRTVNYTIQLPIGGTLPQSDKGDDGAFRMSSSCGTSRRWIEKADANAQSAFECLAQAGTGGSSLEMPLLATELALTTRVSDGTNQGFRRDDALLAIVILTDEDDCSRVDNDFTIQNDSCATMENLKSIPDFKATFDGVALGPGRWAAAVIAGQSSCESSFGKAIEAKRLKEFVAVAGKNGTFSSICSGDLTGALEAALDTFDAACKAFPPAAVK